MTFVRTVIWRAFISHVNECRQGYECDQGKSRFRPFIYSSRVPAGREYPDEVLRHERDVSRPHRENSFASPTNQPTHRTFVEPKLKKIVRAVPRTLDLPKDCVFSLLPTINSEHTERLVRTQLSVKVHYNKAMNPIASRQGKEVAAPSGPAKPHEHASIFTDCVRPTFYH